MYALIPWAIKGCILKALRAESDGSRTRVHALCKGAIVQFLVSIAGITCHPALLGIALNYLKVLNDSSLQVIHGYLRKFVVSEA